MNFKVEKRDTYSVITMLSERLDVHTTAELRSELVLLAGDSVKNMLLDLSSCNYCDTSGLSAILIAHRLCKDGRLVLVSTSKSVENMLSIQRFDPPVLIIETLAEGEAEMEK
ncbi:MAG: STAS domain-containing protein [Bacteroidales bacterium]|nr:STAS domain-containing protein [Bacteroidales bacterium]